MILTSSLKLRFYLLNHVMFDFITRRLAHNKVTVLLFHKVPVEPDPAAPDEANLSAFARVLDFICSRFRVIPLQDALHGLQSGRLPGASVCLTFDDGYDNWVGDVLPLLERYQAHATFYLTSGQFDGMPLWHERIRHAVLRASGPIAGIAESGEVLNVVTSADRQLVAAQLERELKYMPLAKREQRLLALEAVTDSDPLTVPRMSAEQARQIHNRGFTVGAHTVDHPILSMCTEAEARRELGTAREVLRAVTGANVDCLAYPNGRHRDFNMAHVRLAREVGYTSAVTTEPGTLRSDTPIYEIPRFTPWGPDSLSMQLQMSRNLMRPNGYMKA